MNTKTLMYILKRIGLAVLTLWVVITVTFFVMRAVPGGPFLGEKAVTEAAQAALEAKYGLDNNNMLTNFKNGTWQLIDDVPTNEIETLKTEYPEEFVVAGQIGTYYVCWNINEPLLPEA